jgi:hypothetical protein
MYYPAEYHTQLQQPVRDTKQYPALDLREFNRLVWDGQDSTVTAHDRCNSSALRHNLALHLLQVCRQVYGEAALIPFIKNSFTTMVQDNISALRPFLATLVPAQIRAIAKFLLSVGGTYRLWLP